MPRDPRFDILFTPVRIGPVTAPNRFYQTPHATGFGWQRPRSGAALRGVKAEGGWGVVCTEYCSIHPSSDDSPHAFLTLWDDTDIAPLALTAEAIFVSALTQTCSPACRRCRAASPRTWT